MKLEKLKHRILRPIIKTVPFRFIKKAGFGSLIIVYYHLVSDDAVPHVSHLYQFKNTRQFLDDLEFLRKNYAPIDLSDVIHWSKGLCIVPPNRCLLTFDDGFREIYHIIAPILRARGIPATFFISSAFLDNQELCYHHKASLLVELIQTGISHSAELEISGILANMGLPFSQSSEGILKIDYRRKEALDRIAEVLLVNFQAYLADKQPYLTSGQVRELLDQGFTIGAHSIDHPYYFDLSLAEQIEQTIGSVKRIRETFELDYGAFAFPHNDGGVSPEFFKSIHKTGLVDITFGTGGMLDTGLRSHRQRVSLENPLLPAKEIIGWQYARKLYIHLRGDYPNANGEVSSE